MGACSAGAKKYEVVEEAKPEPFAALDARVEHAREVARVLAEAAEFDEPPGFQLLPMDAAVWRSVVRWDSERRAAYERLAAMLGAYDTRKPAAVLLCRIGEDPPMGLREPGAAPDEANLDEEYAALRSEHTSRALELRDALLSRRKRVLIECFQSDCSEHMRRSVFELLTSKPLGDDPEVRALLELLAHESQAAPSDQYGSFEPTAGPTVVFVLGGPGAGKGVQCSRIAERFGFAHLSAGELLREELLQGGPRAAEIEAHMASGTSVPAAVTVRLLEAKMHEVGWDGQFLVDGFPRNLDNLQGWQEALSDRVQVRCCLFLALSEAAMEARLLERAKTSGRVDDTPEAIQQRLTTFAAQSLPVVELFREHGLLREVSAEPEPDEVWAQVRQLFEEMP